MTVNELNTLTCRLIQHGHGTKKIYQAYDCNEAYTGIGGKLKIKENGIYFIESMYPDRSEEGEER